MADDSNPLAGLQSGLGGLFGKGNQSQPNSWTPQAPVTYENGQWVQNGKPVGPVNGGASTPGFGGGQGGFSQAMQYLSRLHQPAAPPATVPAAPNPYGNGPPLSSPPPAQNGQQNPLMAMLMGLKAGGATPGAPGAPGAPNMNPLAQILAQGGTPPTPAQGGNQGGA